MDSSVGKTLPSDHVRRLISLLLAVLLVVLFFFGTRFFSNLGTRSFNAAGFAVVPLGAFFVGILLIPLMSAVHGLWVSADPRRRAAAAERTAAEARKVRLSAKQAARAAADVQPRDAGA